jgi:Ca2+-binding EF-hand superfamily protein
VAIREHFRTTDVNEDGSVSFDEFVRRVLKSCIKRFTVES